MSPKATVKLQTVKGGASIKNVNDCVKLCPALNGCIFDYGIKSHLKKSTLGANDMHVLINLKSHFPCCKKPEHSAKEWKDIKERMKQLTLDNWREFVTPNRLIVNYYGYHAAIAS